MTELRPNIVFHGRHFVHHLEICNPICVKHLQVMFGVIPSNLKEKQRIYLKPFSWGSQTRHTHTHTHRHTHTHTHTHTHDDGIRRNAMRCISPKNDHITINVVINSDNGKLIKLTFVLYYFICISNSQNKKRRKA